MSWRHTVLELYQNDGTWPADGDPADWIEKGLVSWCQGADETVVFFTPMWRILYWKLGYWLETYARGPFLNLWLGHTPWGRKKTSELDKWLRALPVVHGAPPTAVEHPEVKAVGEGGVQRGVQD